jgi:hypothetical protein
MEEVLGQCEEYFERRAEIDAGEHGRPEGNEEAILCARIKELLG